MVLLENPSQNPRAHFLPKALSKSGAGSARIVGPPRGEAIG